MLADVQQAIEAVPLTEPLVVLADFDGTLAELHPNPAAPMLTPMRREWLRDIAAQPNTFAGIVSGRRIADLRRRAPLPSHLYYAGLHGMEIEHDDVRWQHPDLDRARADVKELLNCLAVVVDEFPGAVLEDKTVSVAVHARAARYEVRAEALARADACAAPWLDGGQLRRLAGSLVVEYLPNISQHKGDAVEWIARSVEQETGKSVWTLFLGDDVTDEDAFRAITRGVGVLVGSRPSAATHQLDGIADVDTLLRWLTART
ncbi:MAG: trehalose-phosphatase [Acidobacteria bacterium]|nr:trehalose-phosphatase [Acidobacteriota bacterium]